jgi:hypothetical protein
VTRALRVGYAFVTALVLVGPALLLAYTFGGGWVSRRGVYLPAPLNLAGALAVVCAAVHATYVLTVPRERRRPAPAVVRVVTAFGTLVVLATLWALGRGA